MVIISNSACRAWKNRNPTGRQDGAVKEEESENKFALDSIRLIGSSIARSSILHKTSD